MIFSIFRTLRHLLNPFQMQKRMPKMGVKSSHFLPEKERKFLFYSFVSVKSVNRALIPDKKKVFFCQSKNIKEKLDTLAFVTFYHKICMYLKIWFTYFIYSFYSCCFKFKKKNFRKSKEKIIRIKTYNLQNCYQTR